MTNAIRILSFSCATLVAVYLLLIAAAVTFAAWRTDLTRTLSDTESRVAALETQYYEAIAALSKTNPASVGLVTPRSVGYVTDQGATVVSFNNEAGI